MGVAESLFWMLVILACRTVMATGRATTHVRRAGIKIVPVSASVLERTVGKLHATLRPRTLWVLCSTSILLRRDFINRRGY